MTFREIENAIKNRFQNVAIQTEEDGWDGERVEFAAENGAITGSVALIDETDDAWQIRFERVEWLNQ